VAERGSEARFAKRCSSEEDNREHLRGEDTQEGGKRIDGGVGDGGGVEPASSHCKPVALKTVAKNFAPAPGRRRRRKARDAEFAEREVGIHQHVPDLAPDATNPAEDERDDKGAASEAELDRLRHSGESDGQRSKRDAEGDADEERLKCTQPVRVLQPGVAIAAGPKPTLVCSDIVD
jgi:hypothetical protein